MPLNNNNNTSNSIIQAFFFHQKIQTNILEMIFIFSVRPSLSIMAYNATHESCDCRWKQRKGLCGLSAFQSCSACVSSDHGRQYRRLRCDQQGASSDSVPCKRRTLAQFQPKPLSFSFQPASQMNRHLGKGTRSTLSSLALLPAA